MQEKKHEVWRPQTQVVEFVLQFATCYLGLFPPCTRMWRGTRTPGGLSIRIDTGRMGEVGRSEDHVYPVHPSNGVSKMYCYFWCIRRSFRSWDCPFSCSFSDGPEPKPLKTARQHWIGARLALGCLCNYIYIQDYSVYMHI